MAGTYVETEVMTALLNKHQSAVWPQRKRTTETYLEKRHEESKYGPGRIQEMSVSDDGGLWGCPQRVAGSEPLVGVQTKPTKC